eukprot:m.291460 g.291460  ORF g.291460 m.291460 type:complete len:340 (+) comp22957_c0_seq7:2942-3961(+)
MGEDAVGCDELKTQLLTEAHDLPMAGHRGQRATYLKVHRAFFWPKMLGDVEEYCKTCDACQRCKYNTQKRQGLLMPLPTPKRAWQVVATDFMSGLTPVKGYDSVQAVTCMLTKHITLFPVAKKMTAAQKAWEFYEKYICEHGAPEAIVCDRDPIFTSETYGAAMKLWGTKFAMSTADHPATDGQSERGFRTLREELRVFLRERGEDKWLELLKQFQFAHNTTVSASTGLTPLEAATGQQPRMPFEVLAEQSASDWEAAAFLKERKRQRIELPKSSRAHPVISVEKLKKYHLSPERFHTRPTPMPTSFDERGNAMFTQNQPAPSRKMCPTWCTSTVKNTS